MDENHSALNALRTVQQRYPTVWRLADELKSFLKNERKHGEGCIFSNAEGNALSLRLQGIDNPSPEFNPALFGALVSWRPTKGIYRFHPGIFQALIKTPLEGEIPSSLFLRMPGQAVYIETPESELLPFPIEGFFAYLSRLGKQDDLQIVGILRRNTKDENEFDSQKFEPLRDLIAFSLPLGNHPVSDLVQLHFERNEDAEAQESGAKQRKYSDFKIEEKRAIERVVSGMLSLVLYLCSEKPEIDDWTPPAPKSAVFGSQRRLIAAKLAKTWEVGLRIGSALDLWASQNIKHSTADGYVNSVRPHVRRAHWHSFWIGKRGTQALSLRWLPPIAVNTNEPEALPAVIRQVVTEPNLN